MNNNKKDFLNILEFADEISVHPNTIRKMIRNGRLSAFKLGGGKTSSYRIARSEIQRMCMVDLDKIIDQKAEEKIKGKKNE